MLKTKIVINLEKEVVNDETKFIILSALKTVISYINVYTCVYIINIPFNLIPLWTQVYS